jgi:hypothetical protein
MSFPRPIQRYHSHADLIWLDGTAHKLRFLAKHLHILKRAKNSAEYTITRQNILVSLSKNIAWTQEQWCTLSNHQQKFVVYSTLQLRGQSIVNT